MLFTNRIPHRVSGVEVLGDSRLSELFNTVKGIQSMSLYSAVREVIGMNTHRAGKSINVVRCRGLMIGT